jgi:hypothetical protein
MKIKASIQVRSVVGVILMFCGLQLYGQQTASGAEAAAKAATIITFDFPGSGGTEPVAINPAGTITGFYTDAMGITRGFLRAARDGTLTTFDPLGSQATIANGINPAGAITGTFFDAGFTAHGFLRIPAHQDDDNTDDNEDFGDSD